MKRLLKKTKFILYYFNLQQQFYFLKLSSIIFWTSLTMSASGSCLMSWTRFFWINSFKGTKLVFSQTSLAQS